MTRPEHQMDQPETPHATLGRNHVDLLKAYKLRVVNRLSYREIGQQLGQHHSSVHRALTDLVSLLPTTEQQQAYANARPEILGAVEERLLASLVDEEKISKANLNNVAYALTQVSSLRRLETGQSTANINTISRLIGQSDDRLFNKGMGTGMVEKQEPAQVHDKTEGTASE